MKTAKSAARKLCLFFLLIILAVLIGFFVYAGSYYHADPSAAEALESDDRVTVAKTEYGWMFDGPSEEDVLVFYPGAKVEETAYAPLLHLLAGRGIDVCMVKMPFRLAVLDMNRMDQIPETGRYTNCYIGGHSLGGSVAGIYASAHSGSVSGLILLAAYPTEDLSENLSVLSIYGSEDGVLNRVKAAAGKKYVHGVYTEYVIEGGNHALFGSYGIQKGDGKALITPKKQWEETADSIIDFIGSP